MTNTEMLVEFIPSEWDYCSDAMCVPSDRVLSAAAGADVVAHVVTFRNTSKLAHEAIMAMTSTLFPTYQ